MSRIVLHLAAALGFSGAPSVDAPTEPHDSWDARLRWEAPANCPDRDQMIAAIDALLASSPIEPSPELTADGRIRAVASGYALALQIRTASGERTRELVAARCDDLGDLAALLVAIAIDPGAASRMEPSEAEAPELEPPALEPSEPEPSEPEPSEPGARVPGGRAHEAPRPPAPSAPVPAAREDVPLARELGASLTAGVGLSLGALPSATAAVSVAAALRWRALRAELGLVHRVLRPVQSNRGTGGAADLWSTAGIVDLCGVPSVPRIEFPLCGGVEAGTLAGRGRDVTGPATGRAAWVAFRAGAGLLALPWRRVGLGVRATALVPVVRATFEIEGVGPLHRVGAIAGDVTAVVEVRFP